MSNEHPFHIDYHARAFSMLWDAVDSRLSELEDQYSSAPGSLSDLGENLLRPRGTGLPITFPLHTCLVHSDKVLMCS